MASESSDRILSLLLAVLGQAEESPAVNQLLSLLKGERTDEVRVERKVYPNITYLNYHTFGISLQLESSPSSAEKSGSNQVVTAIDIYNHAPKAFETEEPAEASKREKKHEYAPFPIYPIRLGTFNPSTTADVKTSDTAPPPTGSLDITPSTSGTEFVQALGEPSRKGGGEGPIGRGPAAWMEWTGTLQSLSLPTVSSSVSDTLSERQNNEPEAKDGFGGTAIQIMVELGGPGITSTSRPLFEEYTTSNGVLPPSSSSATMSAKLRVPPSGPSSIVVFYFESIPPLSLALHGVPNGAPTTPALVLPPGSSSGTSSSAPSPSSQPKQSGRGRGRRRRCLRREGLIVCGGRKGDTTLGS